MVTIDYCDVTSSNVFGWQQMPRYFATYIFGNRWTLQHAAVVNNCIIYANSLSLCIQLSWLLTGRTPGVYIAIWSKRGSEERGGLGVPRPQSEVWSSIAPPQTKFLCNWAWDRWTSILFAKGRWTARRYFTQNRPYRTAHRVYNYQAKSVGR